MQSGFPHPCGKTPPSCHRHTAAQRRTLVNECSTSVPLQGFQDIHWSFQDIYLGIIWAATPVVKGKRKIFPPGIRPLAADRAAPRPTPRRVHRRRISSETNHRMLDKLSAEGYTLCSDIRCWVNRAQEEYYTGVWYEKVRA